MWRLIAALLPVLVAVLVGAVPALAWTWPADGPVLEPFRIADDPYAGGQHRGIDVGAPSGSPVRAPAAGAVSFAGAVPGGGRTLTIATADGYAVTLLHLSTIEAEEGQTIMEGDVVATIGPTGVAEHAEAYVHLGIRLADDPNGYVDPLLLLPVRGPADVGAASPPAAEGDPAGSEDAPGTAAAPLASDNPAPSTPAGAGGGETAPDSVANDPAEAQEQISELQEAPAAQQPVEAAEPAEPVRPLGTGVSGPAVTPHAGLDASLPLAAVAPNSPVAGPGAGQAVDGAPPENPVTKLVPETPSTGAGLASKHPPAKSPAVGKGQESPRAHATAEGHSAGPRIADRRTGRVDASEASDALPPVTPEAVRVEAAAGEAGLPSAVWTGAGLLIAAGLGLILWGWARPSAAGAAIAAWGPSPTPGDGAEKGVADDPAHEPVALPSVIRPRPAFRVRGGPQRRPGVRERSSRRASV
jgi:Peptidase family M23